MISVYILYSTLGRFRIFCVARCKVLERRGVWRVQTPREVYRVLSPAERKGERLGARLGLDQMIVYLAPTLSFFNYATDEGKPQ